MGKPAPSGVGPLSGLTFCLAGPGKVGTSLAAWLIAAGARLTTVAGRDALSPAAEGLAGRLGGRAVPLDELGGAGEDLLLIAVPDPALTAVAARLARPGDGTRAPNPRARTALHTAGSLGASALAPLAALSPKVRAAVGSLHPLKAFPRPLTDPEEARGTVCAVDGGPEAVALARRITGALGATAVEVPEPARRLYHFAATLAAGGVTTLVSLAAEMAEDAGLPADELAAGYLALARGALAAARSDDLPGSITGPVARGDAPAFKAGLAELTALDPRAAGTALAVARETLAQLARRAPLTGGRAELARLLSDPHA